MKSFFNLKKYIQKYLLIFIVFLAFVGNVRAQVNFGAGVNVGFPAFSGQLEFMETADLNGDGISDLVNTNQLTGVRVTFINENGGVLGTPITYNISAGNAKAISLSDSDADGDIDIFIASTAVAGVSLSLFKNAGNGTFSTATSFTQTGAFPNGARTLTPVDYDLDGDLDFFTIAQESSFTDPRLIRFENTGTGYITSSQATGSGAIYNDQHSLEASVFSSVNLNPELIFVCNDANVYKISNLANIITTSVIYTEINVPFPLSDLFVSVAVSDMDLDGDNDIILHGESTTGASNGIIRVINNNGLGSFSVGYRFPLSNAPPVTNETDMIVEDMDNDGDADIIFSRNVPGGPIGSITIFRNNFPILANFTNIVSFSLPVGRLLSRIVVGDFNIDGKKDIASCNDLASSTDDFYTFLNTSPAASVPLTPDACFQVINNNPSSGNYATSTQLSLQKERDFTVEGWFKLSNTVPTNDQYIFYVGRATNNGFGMYVEVATQELFITAPGATPFTLDLKQKALLGAWMHFALVKENGNLWRFYLNGVESTPLSSDNFDMPTPGGTYFGVDASENNNMNGYLQEMRFWNTALNQKTIRERSHVQPNVSHPKFFTLNSYYPMSENTGTQLNDIAYTINRTALYKFATITQNIPSANFSLEIAPVGDGGSGTTINLTTPILNARNTQGFEADFTGAGAAFPSGDVVVTRVYDTPTNNLGSAINAFPPLVGTPISRAVFSNIYWIIENYSTNANANYSSFLEEITFDIKNNQFVDAGGLPQSFPISSFPATAPSPAVNTQANAFEIYSRSATSNNASDWRRVGVCNAFGSVKARKPGSVVSDFGRIQLVIGVDVTILPIHLASFSGKRINNETNLIEWITTFEYKNQLFEIEKSFDTKEFFRIGTEKPTNKTQVQSYSFTDKYATEAAYYRLKQYDEDGKVNYSKTIFISNQKGTGFEAFSIYPNPASSEINLKITGIDNTTSAKVMQMQVFSTTGAKILDISGNLSEIEQIFNQNINKMSIGLYMVQIQSENRVLKTKFIKN